MHYSKYLRGIPEPVVEQPPVQTTIASDLQSLVATGNNVPVIGSVNMEFKEMRPEDIVLASPNENHSLSFQVDKPIHPTPTPTPAMIQSQEEAEKHVLQMPEPKYVDPIVQKLVDLLANTQDIVTKAKMNKLLDIMFEGLENQLHEPDTILDEYEANRIAEYFVELEEKYFNDIAIDRENLPKHFIWNIPRTMYEDMCKAQDEGVIDVLNPMIYMYIALCGYPGEASARFLKILDDIRFVNVNQFNEYNDKYQEALDAEAGDASDDELEESVSEAFARNGYAAEDEDS